MCVDHRPSATIAPRKRQTGGILRPEDTIRFENRTPTGLKLRFGPVNVAFAKQMRKKVGLDQKIVWYSSGNKVDYIPPPSRANGL